jgi:hypothetical protein
MIKRSTITSLGPIVLLVAFGAAPPEADAGERWLWSITPYMWASDISEDLILRGEVVGGGDTEFKDLLDVVDSSLQLHFEGIQDRWGLFADLTYIDLSDSETGELELLRFDVEITETLFEAGALYRPGGRSGRLDLLFGARLLAVDEVYRLQLGERDPIESSIDESYVDAMFGLRYHIPLSQRWVVSLRGDLSLGGTDLMWTAQGLVGWTFGAKRNSAVFLGYRYRDMKYSKAEFEVEKTLSGPGLGVKIGF